MDSNKEALKKEFFLSQYETIRPLGCKDSINTWLVNHVSTGKLYVKKQVDKESCLLYQKRKDIINSHLVPIEFIYEGTDEFYIIEQYISGDTLEYILEKRKTISEKEAIEYSLQILDGLSAIHENGIVHRDITPSNIIVSTDGIVKIIDFGISRVSDKSKSRDTRLLGTYGYASPEQFGFAQTDARSDIYSVGSLLYRMLYGALPTDTGFVASRNSMGEIIQRAMKIDPNDRYQSAVEMARALKRLKVANKNGSVKKNSLIPGFRTGKTWKMILAVFVYFVMIFFSLVLLVDSFQNKETSDIRNIISTVLFFWIAPLEFADIGYWSNRKASLGEMPKVVRIIIRTILCLLIMLIGIMISDTVPVAK